MKSLTYQFHEVISRAIDEQGVFPHQCLDIKDGKVTMSAVAINDPAQAYVYVKSIMLTRKPDQLAFGLDRFCKEGQGTTLNDCITGAYRNEGTWKPFVIEYQNEPRIVKPIDWENAFWNERIMEDLRHFKL